MGRVIKKSLIMGGGGALLIIGLVGLIMPVLPGIIFIFLGLTCCAGGSERVKKWGTPKKIMARLWHKII